MNVSVCLQNQRLVETALSSGHPILCDIMRASLVWLSFVCAVSMAAV